MVMLSAFGDESADETKQRVFAVAAVVGTEAFWEAAERAWIDRTAGKVFHASTCESEFAYDADLTKHKANLALYRDLTQILAASELGGYGVALDLAAHRECLPDVLPDAGYYKCFTDVVRRITEVSGVLGQQVEFTFDQRRESTHNVGVLYGLLVNSPEWNTNIFMRSKIGFETRSNPRIQMADLIARETMKELDRQVGPKKRDSRQSLLVLRESGGFRFQMHDRAYCEEWRDEMPKLRAASGFTESGYAQWLQASKLRDNWSNRFRYMIWLEKKDRLS